MIYPKVNTVRKYAKNYNRIPIYKELNLASLNLLSLLKALQNQKQLIFLESSRNNKKWSRFSYFGLSAKKSVQCFRDHLLIENGTQSRHDKENLFDYIEGETQKYSSPTYPQFGDFNGGLTGYFGYELVNYTGIMRTNMKENKDLPLAYLIAIDDFIVYDNKKDSYFLATCLYVEKGQPISHQYDAAIEYLHTLAEEIYEQLKQTTISYLNAKPETSTLHYSESKEAFMTKVNTVREMITQGEAIQVVLSVRALIKEKIDPYKFYLKLREMNPSPYMFFVKLDDLFIVGSSPEIHVKVEDRKVYLKPIAGTIKQSPTRKGNLANKQTLLNDPKERAEHLMLVDLARNDLGRIGEPGSVNVEQFLLPEDYSHVIHLVSLVTCELSKEKAMIDVLRETFPAGTVSGAPKVRALEIINELENKPRDIYAGAVGYIGFNGYMDTCITIRTAVFSKEEQYLQAGAGIVYDSVADKEYDEVINKLGALAQSLKYARQTEVEEVATCS